jgi:hypothetical protein
MTTAHVSKSAIDASESAEVKTAAAWVAQLARTLKTCRLYEANNPTVIKFREDLACTLVHWLTKHGRMVLSFTSTDILSQGVSLYCASSREDNLALPFYRDGVRTIAFVPGITANEVEALVNIILHVTRRDNTEEDLVTLLWDANLEHVSVDAASTEGDVETGSGADEEDTGPIAPWPKRESATPGASAPTGPGVGSEPEQDRSDDRVTGVRSADLQAAFQDLQGCAAKEVERLRGEYEIESAIPIAKYSLELVRACLPSLIDPADRAEVGGLLPRVLHETLAQGMWGEARAAIVLLRQLAIPGWSPESLTHDLMQPTSLTTRHVIERLDGQDTASIEVFVELARELGAEGLEWLMRLLAESKEQRTRRALLRLIAEVARDNPERLASWLADERWYVVRNLVHILGSIGGSEIAGLLDVASRHQEVRVRREVVAALAQVDPAVARPRLLALLDRADSQLVGPVLHQLSGRRDREVARRLLREVQAPTFEERSDLEKQSIFSALAATADDDVLPTLEAELHAGNWLRRGPDARRIALARCVARIGTSAARELLERGANSRRTDVARACQTALPGFRPRT